MSSSRKLKEVAASAKAQLEQAAAAVVAPASCPPSNAGVLPEGWMRDLACVACGAVFGAALQRGRVHESMSVIAQFSFSKFVMLKMFLAASATSSLAIWANERLLGVPSTRRNFHALVPRGLPVVATGAGLLGVGMALTGSCPGTVWAQLGAGSAGAWTILAGGLTGAALYGTVETLLSRTGRMSLLSSGRCEDCDEDAETAAPSSFASTLGLSPSSAPLVVAGAMYALVAALEYFVPWRADLKGIVAAPSWAVANAPALSGIAIGLVQIPMQYLLGAHLGAGNSFCCVVGNVAPVFSESRHVTACTVGARGQVKVMAGVALGAALSALATGAAYASDGIVSPARRFFGGALLVFGANLAAGCTSGHGLSGMAFQSKYSLVAVASMFGSAIATTLLLGR